MNEVLVLIIDGFLSCLASVHVYSADKLLGMRLVNS